MICQNIAWLAWPPPLLRTAVRMASGTFAMLRIRSSMECFWKSGYCSSAAFRFVTYAAWCFPWWICIVIVSMNGSSASCAYGRAGSSCAILVVLLTATGLAGLESLYFTSDPLK